MSESQNYKILIVDDQPLICAMLVRMLKPLRHEVETAHDGEEAFRLCQEHPFDLVISDIKMPKMDGMALLKALREHGFDCAFVILTAHGDLDMAIAARDRYNVYNYLIKPIRHPQEFLFEVQSALSRRALELENRKLLNALQHAKDELEIKVRDRTRELELKNEELRRISNFRADILRVLGHELRTPLGLLGGYVDLIKAYAPQASEGHFGKVRESLERLQKIADNALANQSYADSASFDLSRSPMQPRELCRNVMERIQPLMQERDLLLELTPGAELPTCAWDCGKIEALVEELLVNAIRFTPDGGTVRVTLAHRGDTVTIAVEDSGRGIAQDERHRIFEPFVTLGSPDHHSSGRFLFGAQGVGLGLSTASLWARLHGGTLRADPNEGRPGTTFTVELPVG